MADLKTIFNTADQSTPGYYGPSETALLLLDFHSQFVSRCGESGRPALEAATRMRNWAKQQGIHVIHCLVDLDSTPWPACKNYDRLVDAVASLKQSAGGGEEPAELLEGGGDATYTRRIGYVSALKSPGLLDFLKEKGVRSLVLAGLSTSGCVMRTAVTAYDEEFVVTVISDGCADPGEGVHGLLVGKVLNSRGYVTTTAEFQEGFAKARNGK